MRVIFVVAMTILIAVTASAQDYHGDADFTVEYESAGGLVTFPHGLHAHKLEKQCNFCHSALRTFGGVSQIYGHKLCGDCHKKKGGPAKCNACHDRSRIKKK